MILYCEQVYTTTVVYEGVLKVGLCSFICLTVHIIIYSFAAKKKKKTCILIRFLYLRKSIEFNACRICRHIKL